jgi:endonuclease/exonuclease/phosphatase family metal-dependent hydrolase
VWRVARTAVEWSDGEPLVFGGDLNVRPCEAPGLYQRLERELGLSVPTTPDAIDHLLARGLEIERPPAAWPPESRELEISLPAGMRRLRLSDHAPVAARFRVPLR